MSVNSTASHAVFTAAYQYWVNQLSHLLTSSETGRGLMIKYIPVTQNLDVIPLLSLLISEEFVRDTWGDTPPLTSSWHMTGEAPGLVSLASTHPHLLHCPHVNAEPTKAITHSECQQISSQGKKENQLINIKNTLWFRNRILLSNFLRSSHHMTCFTEFYLVHWLVTLCCLCLRFNNKRACETLYHFPGETTRGIKL